MLDILSWTQKWPNSWSTGEEKAAGGPLEGPPRVNFIGNGNSALGNK
jgi:hypothetical protein